MSLLPRAACRLGRASAMTQRHGGCDWLCRVFASLDPTYDTSSIYRKAPGEGDRLFLHLRFDLGITRLAIGGEAVEHLGHEAADMPELGDAEAARGAGWRADPDPR